MPRFLVLTLAFVLAFAGVLPSTAVAAPTASPSPAFSFPTLHWRFATGSEVSTSPQVDGKQIYVANTTGSLYALTAATGKQRWRVRFGSGHIGQSFMSVADGHVFIADSEGNLLAFDGATGRQLWRRHTVRSNDIFSPPTVVAGTVYVDQLDHDRGYVDALDAASGHVRWQAQTGQMESYPLPVANGLVYVADQAGVLTVLDATTGHERWHAQLGQGPADYHGSAPIVSGGTVYVGSYNSALFALDATTGTQRWRVAPGGPLSTTITVSHGSVYFGVATAQGGILEALSAASGHEQWRFVSRDPGGLAWAIAAGETIYTATFAHLLAVEAQTGRQRWQLDPGTGITSPPHISGGIVYVGLNSYLAAIDGASGHMLWRARTGGEVMAAPVVTGTSIYTGSGDGSLYAIAASNVPAMAGLASTNSTSASAETPLADARLENVPPAPAFVGLWRLTYAPGAQASLPAFRGPASVYAESGALTIGPQAGSGQPTQLPAGQVFTLPTSGAALIARNIGAAPTTALVFAIEPKGAATSLSSTRDVKAEFLGGGMATALPGGPNAGSMVSLHRVTLKPGAALPPELTLWPEIVAVDSGVLDLGIAGETAQLTHGTAVTPIRSARTTSVRGREGALLAGGTVRLFSAAGNQPVVVTILDVWGDVHTGEGGGCGGRCLSD